MEYEEKWSVLKNDLSYYIEKTKDKYEFKKALGVDRKSFEKEESLVILIGRYMDSLDGNNDFENMLNKLEVSIDGN